MSGKQKVSAKELAERVGVEPSELRKWLRSEGLAADGEGRRYAFTPQRAGQLAVKFKTAQEQEADAS